MKQASQSHLGVAAISHPGKRGKNNEDRYGVTAFRLEEPVSAPAVLAVLSDGIGGHRAGEVAAEMAVELISAFVAEHGEKTGPVQLLQQAIQHAGQSIHQQAQAVREQAGMGATCACVWIVANRLYTANVGDSRIYLLRGGQIRQLSTDHTWIQEALENGLLQPEEAIGHPNAHVIRRFLGSPAPLQVDVRLRLDSEESDEQALANQGTILLPGDLLLLCSDGLTDLVNDDEISQFLLDMPEEQAVQALTDLANQRGGHDNITMVTLRMPDAPQKKSGRGQRVLLAGCLIILALLILAAGLVWGYLRLQDQSTPTPAPPATQATLPLILETRPAATRPSGPSATHTPALPSLTPQLPDGAPTGGPTLTPWPTHTRQP